MKPSVTHFRDVPDLLNRMDREDSRYARVVGFIELLSEAGAASERLRRTVEAVAGHKFEPDYGRISPERPSLHPLDELPRLISKQFAVLAHTPAPRTEQEWRAGLHRKSHLGRLAERLAVLFLSGHWERLRRCKVCGKWFLGRGDAQTCSAACREKKSERREGFKRRRRAWLLENALIPRVRSRIAKLRGRQNPPQRERWEKRLATYRDELQKISEEGGVVTSG